jgi:hypothetical protein
MVSEVTKCVAPKLGAAISPATFQELLTYPESKLGKTYSSRWVAICEKMLEYVAPQTGLTMDRERKWELVSALQKAIRRGDKEIALHVISAMDSMPADYAHFWRRLCVIAFEDVGPGDDVLATFVVVCSTIFTPKKAGAMNYGLFCFLTEQMCELSHRSHIYCSYAVISDAAANSQLPEPTGSDKAIVSAILQREAAVSHSVSEWRRWQKKNDWRTAGLLKFAELDISQERSVVQVPLTSFRMLYGLPSYCYDVYTRVGLETLRRLIRGAEGTEGIRDLFRRYPVRGANKALGEALFYAEGGRIRGELVYDSLTDLEQRVFSQRFHLPHRVWVSLRDLALEAVELGVVDRVRENVLELFYGEKKCTQLHQQLTLDI